MTDIKRPAHLPKAPALLWDWLEKRDLSQREAAKLLRIPFMTLNHYLHNRRRPSLGRLQTIYELTGIPIALWLDTAVVKEHKRRRTEKRTPQYIQGGNAVAS